MLQHAVCRLARCLKECGHCLAVADAANGFGGSALVVGRRTLRQQYFQSGQRSAVAPDAHRMNRGLPYGFIRILECIINPDANQFVLALSGRPDRIAAQLMKIGSRYAALADTGRSPDEILGYDEHGLPK